MGFRHVVLLTLDADADEIDALVDALRALPDEIPEVRSYVVGVDAGLSPGNATVAVVADTDDRQGWEAYRDHPAHRQVIEEMVTPRLVARVAVQHHVER